MQVTSGIQCNLLAPSYSTIYAPQGDAQSRFVLIQLLEGAAPWEVPAGASVIIRAAKPDGTFCFYDTNESGDSAYSVSGSTVTIELVGQVLAAPGPVLMQIDFYDADGAHLSTFTFCCQVSESVVSDDDIVSSDYFSVLTATLTEMQQIEQVVKAAYGAPLVAATAAAMTDTSRVYVYVGSESGYTNGNWYYYNGSAWVSGGVYNSTAFETDPTLSIAGAAADAKAAGDAIDTLLDTLFVDRTVSGDDLTPINRSITAGNKWTTLGGATAGVYAIPETAERIIINPTPGVTNVWAFLQEIGTPVTGETPVFCEDYPGRITANNAEPRSYAVTHDMRYLYLLQTNTGGTSVFPASVTVYVNKLVDATLSIAGKAADAKVTGDRLASAEDTLDKFFETSTHDFSGDEQLAWTILRSNNTWFAGGTARSYVINAGGAVSVDIQASAAGNCVFAVLKSFRPVREDPVDYAGDTTAVLIQAGNSYRAEIPADAGYLYFSALSSAGVDVTPTVQITTKAAGGNVYNYYNTNTVTNNVTQSTYNVTSTPELSAETLYYLPPTGDATDRSADIAALLAANGICRLGSGTYYVASIDMPNGSAIEGVGASTVLRLIDNVSGYALRMRSRCKVRNLRILGGESYTALNPAAATPGDRIGILWEGILNGDGNTYTYPGLSMISGVWFERIQGSGLKCLNTSSGTRNKLLVSDCYYLYDDAGVNIASVSEFMQFTNCTFNSCYYGVINNGGNNSFANCDFAVCAQCFVIDNSTGALSNPGHSCMVNCDFSHAIKVNSDGTLTSNQGDFIYLAGTGYEFNGCQFGFGHINFTDAEGVLCAGCVWSGRSDNDIYITNGTGIFFVDCLFGAQYRFFVVNNTKTKLINCYTKAGEEVLL